MEALVIHESIQTTEAKAKAIKGQIEKLITKAKNNPDAQRQLQRYFAAPILQKFITDIAPRFMNRPGGYTRIIKLGSRLRDNAKMVVIELVEKKKPVAVEAKVIAPAEEKKESLKEEKKTIKKEVKKTEKKETSKKK